LGSGEQRAPCRAAVGRETILSGDLNVDLGCFAVSFGSHKAP
jgi:hypothetical protein